MVLVSSSRYNSENADITYPRVTSFEITSQTLSFGYSDFYVMVLRSFDISSHHRGGFHSVDCYKGAEDNFRRIISEASASQSTSNYVPLRTKSSCLVGGDQTRCSTKNLVYDRSDRGGSFVSRYGRFS